MRAMKAWERKAIHDRAVENMKEIDRIHAAGIERERLLDLSGIDAEVTAANQRLAQRGEIAHMYIQDDKVTATVTSGDGLHSLKQVFNAPANGGIYEAETWLVGQGFIRDLIQRHDDRLSTQHSQDAHCTVNPDTLLCDVCGGKGFHVPPCNLQAPYYDEPKQETAKPMTCPSNSRGIGDVVGCGGTFTATPDSEGLVGCPHCGMFFLPEEAAKPTLYSVGLYLCDRAYGGPEEGGWYYNTGELVVDPAIYAEIGCLPTFHTFRDASILARDGMAEAAEKLNEGRREISSVASEGRYMAEIHEGLLPAFYPETRPTYE